MIDNNKEEEIVNVRLNCRFFYCIAISNVHLGCPEDSFFGKKNRSKSTSDK